MLKIKYRGKEENNNFIWIYLIFINKTANEVIEN